MPRMFILFVSILLLNQVNNSARAETDAEASPPTNETAMAELLPSVSTSSIERGDAAKSEVCELNVWPAAKMISHLRGWAHAGLVDGGKRARSGYPVIPEAALTAQAQINLLKSMPLATMFRVPTSKVIIHDGALNPREFNQFSERKLKADVSCYAELIIMQLAHDSDALSGKSLNVMMRFTSISPELQTPLSFTSLAGSKLRLFPAADPVNVEKANEELEQAFQTVTRNFGNIYLAHLNKYSKK